MTEQDKIQFNNRQIRDGVLFALALFIVIIVISTC